ncbi:hypothetical protein GCM10010472_53890 [Pseudonocardia halophobica]|uniref:Uncharacterized protein n=1 Tax=Pseudonocardia halophobica TaxID=29401 RepID=A0A9W6L1D7_9PSEU|nr:hypothetical protein GCM10017577_26090 [Pseudonocardia halophobica]
MPPGDALAEPIAGLRPCPGSSPSGQQARRRYRESTSPPPSNAAALRRAATSRSSPILVEAESLVPDTGEDNARPLGLSKESVNTPSAFRRICATACESIELLTSEVLRRRRDEGQPDVDRLAADLTRQSRRYLYRILFLLYAKARPELDVLPSGHRVRQGLALDRPLPRARAH